MTNGECVVCGDDIDSPAEGVSWTSGDASVHGTHWLHTECWNQEGLGSVPSDILEVSIPYYDARQAETYWGALEIFRGHFGTAPPDTLVVHGALNRLAETYGGDDD